MKYTEEDLLNNEEVREQLIKRVDVLDKVRELLLLPGTEYATTEQIAKYYKVGLEAINTIVNRHRDELESDGMKIAKKSDIKRNVQNEQNVKIVQHQSHMEVVLNDLIIKIANRGARLFPKRAILRIGMLLRDSEVAKEVRTQLLNIEEKVSNEDKIVELDYEKQLVLDAVFGEDVPSRTIAIKSLIEYKNKHIKQLEAKNQALAEGIVRWGRREAVNSMARKIAMHVFKDHGKYAYVKAWEKIRAEMLYKHNIHITKRIQNKGGNATIFDVLNDDELNLLVQSCVALCEMYKINIDNLFIEDE